MCSAESSWKLYAARLTVNRFFPACPLTFPAHPKSFAGDKGTYHVRSARRIDRIARRRTVLHVHEPAHRTHLFRLLSHRLAELRGGFGAASPVIPVARARAARLAEVRHGDPTISPFKDGTAVLFVFRIDLGHHLYITRTPVSLDQTPGLPSPPWFQRPPPTAPFLSNPFSISKPRTANAFLSKSAHRMHIRSQRRRRERRSNCLFSSGPWTISRRASIIVSSRSSKSKPVTIAQKPFPGWETDFWISFRNAYRWRSSP